MINDIYYHTFNIKMLPFYAYPDTNIYYYVSLISPHTRYMPSM